MRGQQQLIALRSTGFVPSSVWIETEHDQLESWRDWDELDNRRAQLQIEPTDKRFDLRCVIGLMCIVQGSDKARVHAVRDACIDAGAQRVVSHLMERFGSGEFVAFRMVECTDTEGTWNLTTEQCEAIDG